MSRFRILLVEDNPRDAELVELALKESDIEYDLHVAVDGELALQHLNAKESGPDLVLLDLNIPKYSGIEVLKKIRESERTRTLPVIILTNSNSMNDVRQAYFNGCNAYLRKPLGFDALQQTVEVIQRFWFHASTLPPRPETIPPSRPKN